MTSQATAVSTLTRGTVISCTDGKLILAVDGTNYQLHLQCLTNLPAGQSVQGTITVQGKKIWTIPAGGSYITPLYGPLSVVQGVVKANDGKRLVVQAGTSVCIELPADRSAYDLKNGELVPGVMINATTLPGARFDPASA